MTPLKNKPFSGIETKKLKSMKNLTQDLIFVLRHEDKYSKHLECVKELFNDMSNELVDRMVDSFDSPQKSTSGKKFKKILKKPLTKVE